MDKKFLKEVLSVPTYSTNEVLMRDFILNFAADNGIESKVDIKGNVYLIKGEEKMTTGEFYPCVVSHIDTVHRHHHQLIENNERLAIVEDEEGKLKAYHPITGQQTGIGGDDKCGVFVCLSLFQELDVLKGAFFVEEEIGMLGSRVAEREFFNNVGYAIQFDAPSADWITEVCSGVKILDEGFKQKITPILAEGGYKKFSNDPFTDVNQLAQKFDFNCLNLGCGYYQQHSDREYVVVDEVEKSLKMGYNLILFLRNEKYIHFEEEVDNTPIPNILDIDGFEDDYESDAKEIVESIISLQEQGYSKEEIIYQVGDLLYMKDMLKFD